MYIDGYKKKNNNHGHGRRRGNHNNLVLKDAVILHRHNYLQQLFENRNQPNEQRLREVYIDELYIHEHGNHNDRLWEPSDDLADIQHPTGSSSKTPATGRQYCFIAVIQSPNPNVDHPILDIDQASLLEESVGSFCSSQQSSKVGDTNNVLDSEKFIAWFKDNLLPNLLQPSMIILNNAKHHLVYGKDTSGMDVPNVATMNKLNCINYLTLKGLPYVGLSVVQMKHSIKEYIVKNVPMEIVRLANEQGHQVLFIPPYHNDLQPIQVLWSQMIGNIGYKCTTHTTIEQVQQYLDGQLDDVLKKYIDKRMDGILMQCNDIAKVLYDEQIRDEGENNGNGEYNSDDCEHDDDDEYDDDDDVSSCCSDYGQ
jgi:transposase